MKDVFLESSILFKSLSTSNQNNIYKIKQIVSDIWEKPNHQHYTDHGIKHSENIIMFLEKIISDQNQQLLDQAETFILLSACYLHDVGMQCNDRLILEQECGISGNTTHQYDLNALEIIRKKHADLSFRLIKERILTQTIFPNIHHLVVDAIARVSRAHSQNRNEYIASCNEVDFGVPGMPRLRFLAILLRFGDSLDADTSRCNIVRFHEFSGLPDYSQAHFWKHYWVSNISIDNGIVQLHYAIPNEYLEIKSCIRKMAEEQIINHNQDLDRIWKKYNIKLKIGKPDYIKNSPNHPDYKMSIEVIDYFRRNYTSKKKYPSLAKPPQNSLTNLISNNCIAGHYYISYSPKDGKEFAIKLYTYLSSRKIPVWIDKLDDEDLNENWTEAIKTCAGLLFVATPESVQSHKKCAEELQRALRYKKTVIPILTAVDLDLPHCIASRQDVDFSLVKTDEDYSAKINDLYRHLKSLASPEGRIKLLKERLADAKYDLSLSGDLITRNRIQEEINQLNKDIYDQQVITLNLSADQELTPNKIEKSSAQENTRQKNNFSAIEAYRKSINIPPVTIPTYFQNRYLETELIADFIKNKSQCLLTVSGRGGVGKTALVCRILDALENGHFPNELGDFSVAGIIYLSAIGSRKVSFTNLFFDLLNFLPSNTADELASMYRNRHMSTKDKFSAMLEKYTWYNQDLGGNNFLKNQMPVLVLLDNFEDVVNIVRREIDDLDLADALWTLLSSPPHRIKVIITTQIVPQNLPSFCPSRQMQIQLDNGLESPFAENVLRFMDCTGSIGLKTASEEVLRIAKERTCGYPKALEALYGILASDRSTSLEEVLADTKHLLPENVVEALVGEAFNRLDASAQMVMQSLALYNRPVTPSAIDFMLAPYLPEINASLILNRLFNMRFVRKEGGKYFLHPVDKAYALGRIPIDEKFDSKNMITQELPFTKIVLSQRGADYFKIIRLSKDQLKTLDDLSPQLGEIELLCSAEDFNTAAEIINEIGFDYLVLWGHWNVLINMEHLLGNLQDYRHKQTFLYNISSAFRNAGETQKAINYTEQALSLARDAKNSLDEAKCLWSHGVNYVNLGQVGKAIEYCEYALDIIHKLDDKKNEAGILCSAANCYMYAGMVEKAIEYNELALQISIEQNFVRFKAESCFNLGNCYSNLGRTTESIEYFKQAIKIADDISLIFVQNKARYGLACEYLFSQYYTDARIAADAASKFDYLRNNHDVSLILGIVALYEKDYQRAGQQFRDTISQADLIIKNTPHFYRAVYAKAIAFAGLAVYESKIHSKIASEHAESFETMYRQALEICSAKGVVERVQRLLALLKTLD